MENNAPTLKKKLKKLIDQRDGLHSQVRTLDKQIQEIENDLRLLANEDYWKSNPRDPEIKVGDQLVINKDFQDMKIKSVGIQACNHYFKGSWALGRIVTVYELDLVRKQGFIQSDGVTACNFDVIQSMRDDYLEKQRNE